MSIQTATSQTVLDLSYSYDARALLTGLTDAVDSGNSRVMTYDGQERLLTSTGPWGNGNWVYDSLGNLRSQQLGSRSIGLSFDAALRVSRSLDTGGISGQSGISTGDRYFGYDNRGNVTTAGNQGFVYDSSDRVTHLTGAECETLDRH